MKLRENQKVVKMLDVYKGTVIILDSAFEHHFNDVQASAQDMSRLRTQHLAGESLTERKDTLVA
jgi:hypothetical protein